MKFCNCVLIFFFILNHVMIKLHLFSEQICDLNLYKVFLKKKNNEKLKRNIYIMIKLLTDMVLIFFFVCLFACLLFTSIPPF